ncbi:hypothetical protein [Amycolatopsis sp. NPDC051128]|uniref:hypothetical protein n=1 Tax=Amycolatopsis sp. NPDC051128 TaxID=3155412 RepID=UPI0034381A88
MTVTADTTPTVSTKTAMLSPLADASRRASAFGAALRAMRAAHDDASIRPDNVAAIEEAYRAASTEADRLFQHAAWCDRPDTDTHCCMAHTEYIEGVPRMPGDAPANASATAWANEEDAAQSVCLSVEDGEGDSQDGWFSADAARALAAQLTAAADLIDGGVSRD